MTTKKPVTSGVTGPDDVSMDGVISAISIGTLRMIVKMFVTQQISILHRERSGASDRTRIQRANCLQLDQWYGFASKKQPKCSPSWYHHGVWKEVAGSSLRPVSTAEIIGSFFCEVPFRPPHRLNNACPLLFPEPRRSRLQVSGPKRLFQKMVENRGRFFRPSNGRHQPRRESLQGRGQRQAPPSRRHGRGRPGLLRWRRKPRSVRERLAPPVLGGCSGNVVVQDSL